MRNEQSNWDPITADARENAASRRLGKKTQCRCGESRPAALIKDGEGTICYALANERRGLEPSEKHHLVGKANNASTAPVPSNDHRADLSESQRDSPAKTLENRKKSPLLKAAAEIRDTVEYRPSPHGRRLLERATWRPAGLPRQAFAGRVIGCRAPTSPWQPTEEDRLSGLRARRPRRGQSTPTANVEVRRSTAKPRCLQVKLQVRDFGQVPHLRAHYSPLPHEARPSLAKLPDRPPFPMSPVRVGSVNEEFTQGVFFAQGSPFFKEPSLKDREPRIQWTLQRGPTAGPHR
jgi:hypothetical protein